jgi:hypothetical protein
LPYGIKANRKGIDLCLAYAAEQGLVGKIYQAEDVFTDTDP